ncbi:MAG TPA: hypothetical protein VD970_17475, partial [Acetobacteraceae bacterium]|nr:hypothetical protein [Acetobacteraceae bacterium]
APTTSVEEAAPPVPAGEPEPLLLDAGARLDLPDGLGGQAPAICPADVIVESAPSAAEPLPEVVQPTEPNPPPPAPPAAPELLAPALAWEEQQEPLVIPPADETPRDPEVDPTLNFAPVSDLPSKYGSAQGVSLRSEVKKRDEETALRSILQGLSAGPTVATPERDDFLALLNRLHWLRSIGMVSFEGLPQICVSPGEGLYYTHAALPDIAARLAQNVYPDHVRLAPKLRQALEQAGCRDVEPLPLKDLFWVANIRCPNPEQVARFERGAYRLRRWPDLTQLPHQRQHIAWCGLIARRPVTLHAFAAVTEAPVADLAAFLAACAALGILEVVEETAEATNQVQAPQTARSRERTSIFRSLLNRLGFRRS